MARRSATLEAVILDESIELSLGELCRACAVHAEFVVELVDEGVVEPRGRGMRSWRFTGAALRRAHAAARLQRDLEVNLPGVGLALDLLDEIAELRARLRALEGGF
jgi:chaperone modulatory protein CbpM